MNKEELTELVYINLGRASMCWSEIPKGVFDSTKAANLGKEIMEAVDKYINEQKPKPRDLGTIIDKIEGLEKVKINMKYVPEQDAFWDDPIVYDKLERTIIDWMSDKKDSTVDSLIQEIVKITRTTI